METKVKYIHHEGRRIRVECHREDDSHGYVEFAGEPYPGFPVKNPGTYHYDHGGACYQKAVDAYVEAFGS